MPVVFGGGSSGHSKEDYLPPVSPSFDSQPIVRTEKAGDFPSNIQTTGSKTANRIGNELPDVPIATGHDIRNPVEVQGEQPSELNARFQRFAQMVAKGGPTPGHGVATSPDGGAAGEGGEGGGSILEPGA